MQVLMQARNLCLCNAGMLRAISRLWGTDGSGALPTENDACRELGIDVKKELNQRQCFSHLTDIIQQLISGFAEIPKSKVAISRNNMFVCLFVFFFFGETKMAAKHNRGEDGGEEDGGDDGGEEAEQRGWQGRQGRQEGQERRQGCRRQERRQGRRRRCKPQEGQEG